MTHQALKFELIPTLNGVKLDDISTEKLITTIMMVEAEIEQLSKIKTKSVVIVNRIQKLQLNLDQLVEYIDANRKDE